MTEIVEISEAKQKSSICDKVLHALPSWFGIESSIADYIDAVKNMPFFAAEVNGETVGFAALKVHNMHTAEVYVMGILKEYHRRGIGTRLIERCEHFCTQRSISFLTVKTLAASHPDLGYAQTRKFYETMGFKALEVFPELWSSSNPCLFMAKCTSSLCSEN